MLHDHSFPTLTLGLFEESSPGAFYVNTFAKHLQAHHAHITRPHQHDFYVTVLFTKGKGIHEIDFATYGIAPGSVFFLRPGQTHHWEFSEEPEGLICFHSAAFAGSFFPEQALHRLPFFSPGNQGVIELDERDTVAMETEMKRLLDEYIHEGLFRSARMGALFRLLYIDLARLYDRSETRQYRRTGLRYEGKFRELEALVEIHFAREKSGSFYAGQLCVTPRHLNRICREAGNTTLAEIIRDRTMLEARRRIVTGTDSLAEIANDLGYGEYAYFSTVFSRLFGESPSAFRERYR